MYIVPPKEAQRVAGQHPELPDVIEAIGSDRFGLELLNYLRDLCGADYCAVFLLENDKVSEIASGSWDGSQTAHEQSLIYVNQQYWRKDPAISEARLAVAQANTAIVRLNMSDLADTEFRNAIYPKVRERVMVCGRRRDAIFGLSVLRSENHGTFSDEAVGRLANVAQLLVAVLARHTGMLAQWPDPAEALQTLIGIESCLVAMTDLPRRELEVCSRILYGLSTVGISLDLGIGEESVKTYRTRAYRRLSLGSERELLKWYLALWGRWRYRAMGVPPLEKQARPLEAEPLLEQFA